MTRHVRYELRRDGAEPLPLPRRREHRLRLLRVTGEYTIINVDYITEYLGSLVHFLTVIILGVLVRTSETFYKLSSLKVIYRMYIFI